MPAELEGIEPPELTLPLLLQKLADVHGERELLRWPGVRRTFSQMPEAVAWRAGSLRELGIRAGDRVAIMGSNRLETLDLILACAWVGAAAVTINTAARGQQLHHALANSQACLLIAEPEYLPYVELLDPLPQLEHTRLLSEEDLGAAAALPAPGSAADPHQCQPGDTALIVYTSGTTGVSKGVRCLHAQLFWWGINTGWNLELDRDDVLHTSLPLFHTNAVSAFMQALLFGGTYALGPRFSASRFWHRLTESEATVTYLLGAMVRILTERPAHADEQEHHVRLALAPATPPDLHQRFEDRFGVTLVEAYGSTETNHVIGELVDRQRLGTMGRVLAGFRAEVHDDQDQPVNDGQPGELVLRSDEPFSFAGSYERMPEKTVEAWRNLWFHTGDRVIRDNDGFIRFVDRLKDSIRRRGENISAYEVEQAIIQHPAVADVAVFAVPSELAEDEVMATLVPVEGAELDPDALIEYLEPRLAYFAIPRFLDIVDRLPLTGNGKVRKGDLREHGVSALTWDRGVKRREPPQSGR